MGTCALPCLQIGVGSVDEMIEKTVPPSILLQKTLNLGEYSGGLSESDALDELKAMASKNKVRCMPTSVRVRCT